MTIGRAIGLAIRRSTTSGDRVTTRLKLRVSRATNFSVLMRDSLREV